MDTAVACLLVRRHLWFPFDLLLFSYIRVGYGNGTPWAIIGFGVTVLGVFEYATPPPPSLLLLLLLRTEVHCAFLEQAVAHAGWI